MVVCNINQPRDEFNEEIDSLKDTKEMSMQIHPTREGTNKKFQ